MIKNYCVTATLVTYYAKNFIFDTDRTDQWYEYVPDAMKKNLKWEDLTNKQQSKILDAFVKDLENESIEPEADPDVYEESSEWEYEVMVNEA